MRVTINFAKNQQPPLGYTVEWWESDEHYHWVIDEDNCSIAFSSRWQARKSAFKHKSVSDQPTK